MRCTLLSGKAVLIHFFLSLRYMFTSSPRFFSQKIILYLTNMHKKARNYQKDKISFFFLQDYKIWAMHFISN